MQTKAVLGTIEPGRILKAVPAEAARHGGGVPVIVNPNNDGGQQ